MPPRSEEEVVEEAGDEEEEDTRTISSSASEDAEDRGASGRRPAPPELSTSPELEIATGAVLHVSSSLSDSTVVLPHLSRKSLTGLALSDSRSLASRLPNAQSTIIFRSRITSSSASAPASRLAESGPLFPVREHGPTSSAEAAAAGESLGSAARMDVLPPSELRGPDPLAHDDVAPMKRTCGREVRYGFRVTVLCLFILVLFIMAVALTATTSAFFQSSVNDAQTTCRTALDSVSTSGTSTILQMGGNLALIMVMGLSSVVARDIMMQPQTAAYGLNAFLQTFVLTNTSGSHSRFVDFNVDGYCRVVNSSDAQYDHIENSLGSNVEHDFCQLPVSSAPTSSGPEFLVGPFPAPPGLGVNCESIVHSLTPAPFIFSNTRASPLRFAQVVYLARNNTMLGYNTSTLALANWPGSEVALTTRQTSQIVAADGFYSNCPVDFSTGERIDVNQTCPTTFGYCASQRPWYQVQSRHNASDSLEGVWTDLYVFPSGKVVGVTFTLPFAPLCNEYSCLEGVLAADLTTVGISEFCVTQVLQLIGLMDPKFHGHPTLFPENPELQRIFNEVGMFVVVGSGPQEGYLVGGSPFVDYGPNDPNPGELRLANESSAPAIRNASLFISATAGGFSDIPSFGTELVFKWDANTSDFVPCNLDGLSAREIEVEVDQCVAVAAITIPYFQDRAWNISGSPQWVAVLSLPVKFFLENVTAQFLNASNAAEMELAEIGTRVQQATDISAGAAALITVVGMILCFVATVAVTKPLKRLVFAMAKLQRLDFAKTDAGPIPRYSRVAEVNTLQHSFSQLRRALETFSRFVPETVVRNIVSGDGVSRQLHVERRVVTIMFSDIRNFTNISEMLPERDLLALLTRYLTIMTHIVECFEGVVGEVLGDGLLVFWNTPDRVEQHEAKACAAALAMHYAMIELNRELSSSGADISVALPELSIRIGIHTGPVLTGNIGSDLKMKFGCMGDPVNLASRLEGLCKLYGARVLISGDTERKLPRGSFVTREVDLVTVKGKSKTTRLFEVVAMSQDFDKALLETSSYARRKQQDADEAEKAAASASMASSGWNNIFRVLTGGGREHAVTKRTTENGHDPSQPAAPSSAASSSGVPPTRPSRSASSSSKGHGLWGLIRSSMLSMVARGGGSQRLDEDLEQPANRSDESLDDSAGMYDWITVDSARLGIVRALFLFRFVCAPLYRSPPRPAPCSEAACTQSPPHQSTDRDVRRCLAHVSARRAPRGA